jgi:hypothetical protein
LELPEAHDSVLNGEVAILGTDVGPLGNLREVYWARWTLPICPFNEKSHCTKFSPQIQHFQAAGSVEDMILARYRLKINNDREL